MAKILKRGMKGDPLIVRLQEALHLQADGIYGRLTEEAVREWQRDHGLAPDGVAGPKTLESIFGNEQLLKKSKRRIDEIIVHCTATRDGQPITVDAIRRMHMRERGWSDIGYHYVVYLDGSVHEGRDVNIAGAHCTGHNTHSIGVVYVGGVMRDGKTPKDTRNEAQKAGLLDLLRRLKKLYPNASIHGHREFANKACPCFDAKREYKDI